MSRNEYDSILETLTPRPPNPYDALLGNADAPLRASMIEAAKTTPDRHAEVLKLSQKTLLPPEIVDRNFDQIRQRVEVQSNDYDRILRDTPKLAEWIRDPNNAKVAHDDLDQLGHIETLLNIGKSIVGNVMASTGTALEAPSTLLDITSRSYNRAIQALGLPPLEVSLPWWLAPLKAAGGELRADAQFYQPSRETVVTKLAGNVAQLLPLLGAGIVAGPEAVAGIFAAGGIQGIEERAAESGKEGTLSTDVAALSVGALNAVAGEFGVERLLERVPPKIRNYFLQKLADLAISSGHQAALQAALQLAHNVGTRLAIDPRQDVIEDVLEQALLGGATGAIARGVLGVALPALGGKLQRMEQARQVKALLEAIAKPVQESKTYQRMPPLLRDFVKNAKPTDNFYVPTEPAERYFQEKNLNPEDVLGPEGAKRFQQALDAKEDTPVSVEDYVTRVLPSEHARFFNEIVRADNPEAMNYRESELFRKESKIERTPEEAAYEQDKALDDSAEQVRHDIIGSLTGQGFSPRVVDSYAQIYYNAFRTAALRKETGETPYQLYEPYRLKITRPLPEILRTLPDIDTQLDPLIDRLRSGKLPSQEEMFGKSLVDFLREKGGVKDEGGDLASREADKDKPAYKKRLINNTKGLPLDTARELAAEAGYIPKGGSIAEFLDVIDRELRGQPVYAQGADNPQAVEQNIILEQLDQYLKSRDIDLKTASNAEIRKALKEGAQVPAIDAATGTLLAQPKYPRPPYRPIESELQTAVRIPERVPVVPIEATESFTETSPPELRGRAFSQINRLSRYRDGKKAPSGQVRNRHTGWRVKLWTDGLKEAANFVDSGARLVAFEHLPELIREGTYLRSAEDRVDANGPPWDYLYTPFTWDGRTYVAKLTLKQEVEGTGKGKKAPGADKRFYSLHAVEIGEPAGFSSDLQAPGPAAEPPSPTGSLEGTAETALTSGTQPTLSTTDLYSFVNDARQNVTTLFQEGSDLNLDKRGTIHFGPNDEVSIEVLKDANLSTFLHETGHFWFHILGKITDELKARPGELSESQQRMIADMDVLLKHSGYGTRERMLQMQQEARDIQAKIQREHRAATPEERARIKELNEPHEIVARSLEAYFREGKAPSPELRPIFRRFKAWLENIYRSLTQLNVHLTDEVRGVFDRYLASDEAIQRAREDAQIREMIENQGQAERLGLSPEEYRAYGETVREARDRAQETLDREYLDEFNRYSSEWYQARRREVREQVAADVHGQRDYMVLSFLKSGTLPDGSPLPEGITEFKLDAKALEDRYGKYKDSSIIKRLRELGIYRRAGGMDPDAAAEMFGYSSGDEMIQALLKLRPMDALIEAETDDRMKHSYGDMRTDGTAPEKARQAVMTEGRAKVIEAEMRALAKKVRETAPFRELGAMAAKRADRQARAQGLDEMRRFVPSVALARDIANERIAEMRSRDITPELYFTAARKEGNLAIAAVNRGDFDEALTHKQRELINVEMYRAATEWKKEEEQIRDTMRSFDDPKKRGRIGKAGEEYLDQIDKLRERFDFSRQTPKALDKRASLLAFIKSEEAKGHELAIPLELQNEARRMNYREMTPEELRGLHDAVQSIAHWANFKNKLLRQAAKRELDQLAADGVTSIDGNSRGPRKMTLEMRLPGSAKGRKLESFFLAHLPLGSILREMDGFKDGGFLFENVMRPIDEAGHAEAVRLESATKAVTDIYNGAYKGEETQLWEKQFIPEINDSLTKWGRLMVALNWGNEGNRKALMDGFTWNEPQVQAILDTLDERDWTFVQGIFDHIDSYAKEIADKQQRVTGVRPEMVEATPIHTRFGEFRGGYFPISDESRLSARAGANEEASFAKLIEAASYTKATTARGHTIARLENRGKGKPLRLDPGVITEHLQQVIHDLTHHEMLIDVGRLLGRKDIQDAIYRNHGDVASKEIKSHIRDIALGRTPAPDWYRTYAAIRSNSVTARLGWNMVTAMVHIPNITSGMVRVGPKWVVKGVIDSLTSAKGAEHSAQWVAEQSDMMRLRWKHRMVELSEFRDQIGLNRGQLASEIHDAAAKLGIDPETAAHFKDSYLYAIHRILQFAEIPTWVGAYEKAIAGGAEATDARAQADRAILDSIGGGQMKDVPSVQKGAIGKIFTTFMTYPLSMHRLGREVLLKDEGALRKMVDASLLVMLPVAFVTAVHHFAKPQKKEEGYLHALLNEAFDHAVGMFVGARELQGAFQRPEYSGPASFGVFGSLKKAAFRIEQGKSVAGVAQAVNEAAGQLFGYPAYQAEKTIEGALALWEGKTRNPEVLLFGPPAEK